MTNHNIVATEAPIGDRPRPYGAGMVAYGHRPRPHPLHAPLVACGLALVACGVLALAIAFGR